MNNPDGLLLPGLDGANPLGFLAAIGLLKTLSDNEDTPQIQMAWRVAQTTWIPCVRIPDAAPLDEARVLDWLDCALVTDRAAHPANLYDELRRGGSNQASSRRTVFAHVSAQATYSNRARADFLAAIASDMAAPDATNQLQTTRRDYHLKNIDAILKHTKREHLRRTLFLPWDYADSLENQSLHLDPSEDRRYAYQWNMPSGDPNRKHGNMLGANRLAIEAIEWFTSLPRGDRLTTVGFFGHRAGETRWTWLLWSAWASAMTVPSLLTLEVLQAEVLDEKTGRELAEMGVTAVFRTRRILVEKTPNFTPAVQLM